MLLSSLPWATGCSDLGDEHANWSMLDRPLTPDTRAPPDAGAVEDAGALDAALPVPDQVEVVLQYILIGPAYVRVAVGGTVTWRNLDILSHDVTSGSPEAPTPLFYSGVMATGDAYSHRFESSGRFIYYCALHSSRMRDAVVEVVGDAP